MKKNDGKLELEKKNENAVQEESNVKVQNVEDTKKAAQGLSGVKKEEPVKEAKVKETAAKETAVKETAVKETPAKEEPVKEEKTVAENKAASGREKKTSAKKAAEKNKVTRKERAKRETVKKEMVKKETAKKEPQTQENEKVSVYIEYGNSQYSEQDIIENVKRIWVEAGHRVSSIKELNLYIKPEEGKAYYVINGKNAGSIEL